MREISTRQAAYEKNPASGAGRGWYDVVSDETLLRDVPIVDVGDLVTIPGENNDGVIARACRTAKVLTRQDCLPVILGGDHSISYATVKALARTTPDIAVVVFDAHADRGSWERGTPHHHANVFTRLLTECPNLQLWQVGLRGLMYEQPHPRVRVVTAKDLRDASDLARIMPHGHRCFISVDVDVMDPAFLSSTGTPVPFGIDGLLLSAAIAAVCSNNIVLGVDLVELNPLVGVADASADLAVAILIRAIHAAYRSCFGRNTLVRRPRPSVPRRAS